MKKAGWLVLLALVALGAGGRRKKGPHMGNVNPRTGQPIVSHGGAAALTRAELVTLAQSVGLPDAAAARAADIAIRESGGQPDTQVDTRGMTSEELYGYWGKSAGPELSIGLWQINLLAFPHYTAEQLKDPIANARAMAAISHYGTNWGPWKL